MTVFIVLAVNGFPGTPDEFSVPGDTTLTLKEGEEKTIYKESGYGSTSEKPRCLVQGGNERSVELDEAGSFTFTSSGDEYTAQYHFKAPSAGSYRVSCTEGRGIGLRTYAVGDRVKFASFGLAIAGAIGAPLLGFLLSAVMAIVVGLRRSRHKRRLQDEALR